MSVFSRSWEAPTSPARHNALAIGIGFLVNIGYGGPVADESGSLSRMAAPALHRWPPIGLTPTTPRRHIIRQVLHSALGLGHDERDKLGTSIAALAKRTDDGIFVSQFAGAPDQPLAANGSCLAPALVVGDEIVEMAGEDIVIGDVCAIVLRGTVTPLTKVFAGLIDREGFPAALFYLRTPEQVIEVPLADVLYARKVQAPRTVDGHALLADADPFVVNWRQRFYLADAMKPVGTSRTAAWVESMTDILAAVRGQPAMVL